ncbi:MAG: hypothetical protein V3V92_03540, partial [Candidatus Hydrothermarchaeales archaeon]
LYLDLKRKPIEEEEKAFEGKGVSVGELLEEALRSTDRTEEEMSFAYELFRVLSEKDIEKAVEVAQEFYGARSGGGTSRPSDVHEKKSEHKAEEARVEKTEAQPLGQRSLEAFK